MENLTNPIMNAGTSSSLSSPSTSFEEKRRSKKSLQMSMSPPSAKNNKIKNKSLKTIGNNSSNNSSNNSVGSTATNSITTTTTTTINTTKNNSKRRKTPKKKKLLVKESKKDDTIMMSDYSIDDDEEYDKKNDKSKSAKYNMNQQKNFECCSKLFSSVSSSVTSLFTPSSSSSTTTVTTLSNNNSNNSSSTTMNTIHHNIQRIIQKPKIILQKTIQNSLVQKFASIPLTIGIFLLFKKIFLNKKSMESFFLWMEEHPIKGLIVYLVIYPLHMLLFLPGTPLVMGAGYIFKVKFGWLVGVSLCSIISLGGSLMGSVMCFLVGRYCLRGTVRRWSKKYPLFDPIDAAVSENSFKIMTLLYLTPVMPLGPLSYIMGTTSMPLISFAKAKIAALPLTVMYVYLGAATGTLVAEAEGATEALDGGSIGGLNNNINNNNNIMNSVDNSHMDVSSIGSGSGGGSRTKGIGELKVDPKVIVFGILCSIGSIALISIKMKQELNKILYQQNRDEEIMSLIHDDHPKGNVSVGTGNKTNNNMGKTRQRPKKAPRLTTTGVDDIEQQQ